MYFYRVPHNYGKYIKKKIEFLQTAIATYVRDSAASDLYFSLLLFVTQLPSSADRRGTKRVERSGLLIVKSAILCLR